MRVCDVIAAGCLQKCFVHLQMGPCFSLAEDLSDNEDVFPKEIAKWNSNDLMDKIEAGDAEETPGMSAPSALWCLNGGHSCLSCSPGPRCTVCVCVSTCACVCVCMCAGELFQDLAVDYERANSEERIDEVCECVSTKHTVLTSSTFMYKVIFHLQIQYHLQPLSISGLKS